MSPDPTILSELRKNAQILNESSDDLTRLIKDFEDELSSLNIGVAYWSDCYIYMDDVIEAEDDDQNAEQIVWDLGFCKIGDAWRIAAQRRCLRLRQSGRGMDADWIRDGYVFVDDPIPLSDAPRIIRVEAASKLNSLMIGLNKKMGHYIQSIQDATGAF